MKGWRAALLRFDEHDRPERIDDGLLLVEHGRIVAADDFSRLSRRYPGVSPVDWRGLTLAPGFVDIHLHYPQLDVIGSPAPGLLSWLERYALPHERRFGDPAHAAEVARAFLTELLGNGVTSAMVFCSAHPESVDALFGEAQARRMRVIAGQVLMDCATATGRAGDTELTLAQTEALIGRWHGVGRLGYAIAPRFVPSCSDRQLAGAADLADAHPDVWLQTHVAENPEEVDCVAQRFPDARSYLDVYERFRLLRPRCVMAHGIHIDDDDRARLAASGAAIAVCPSSNQFLGSGLFDFPAASRAGFHWGLASDIGAGTSMSPFRTMLAAYEVGRLRGCTLEPAELWRRHTIAAARAIGLDDAIGNLAPGMDADFVALDAAATPLLARRTAAAATLDEWLFAMIVLGDDRAVRHTVIAGRTR